MNAQKHESNPPLELGDISVKSSANTLAMPPAPNWEQKHLNSKAKKAASSRASKTKVQEEEKIKKPRENNSSEAEEHI
jgi:hypothetical protein